MCSALGRGPESAMVYASNWLWSAWATRAPRNAAGPAMESSARARSSSAMMAGLNRIDAIGHRLQQ
jgi:hypothetical protein